MGDHVLSSTEEEKDVGVTVTSNLKPAAHSARAARTATLVLSQIGRSFTYRDKNIFIKLYTRYVRPHLEFASQAWSPWHQKDIEVLERVQKRAVNMDGGLAGKSYEEKLAELRLDSLSDRHIEADLVLLFKVLKGQCMVNKNRWADMAARDNIITRAAMENLSLKNPFARTEKRANFYTVRICDTWNGLPYNIRAARTVSQFKLSYRAYRDSTRRGPGAGQRTTNH
jgi:hypothetical protein